MFYVAMLIAKLIQQSVSKEVVNIKVVNKYVLQN